MRAALVKLHVAIVLASFTGILGKYIELKEIPLVWWRLLMVIAIMYPFLKWQRAYRRPPLRDLLVLYGIGAVQSLHWILFYGSIKVSTVSVGLVCISLLGFFTAVFSPLILKTRWVPREFLYSAITIAGIALIFHFDTQYRLGIAVGTVSSAIGALYVIFNKKIVRNYPDQTLLFHHEMCGGFIFISLLVPAVLHFTPVENLIPSLSDLVALAILASACTVVMYVLQLQALQKISPFTVNLSFNLEPVYTIFLAAILLGENKTFTASFYLGLGLIAFSVLLQTLHVLRNKNTRTIPQPPSQRIPVFREKN